jgi:purine-binding chemotaxis protein CheW
MDLVNTPATAATEGAAAKYLSFLVDGEEYAVDILRVREIRGVCPLTPLPNAPERVRGVMNLRGAVVPVVDLRVALGVPRAEPGKFSVIVVLTVRERLIGCLVDSVCDVLSLTPASIEENPELGLSARVDGALVAGIARVADRFVVLLDGEKLAPPAKSAP